MYQSVCRPPSPCVREWVCVGVCAWVFVFVCCSCRKRWEEWMTEFSGNSLLGNPQLFDSRLLVSFLFIEGITQWVSERRIIRTLGGFFSCVCGWATHSKLNNWSTSLKDPESGWIIVWRAVWEGEEVRLSTWTILQMTLQWALFSRFITRGLIIDSNLETFRPDNARKVLSAE